MPSNDRHNNVPDQNSYIHVVCDRLYRSESHYFENYGAPCLTASVFDRADIDTDFPFLAEMLESDISVNAIVVARKDFPGLFCRTDSDVSPSGRALIFLLPERFERLAAQLVGQTPQIMNTLTPDLMRAMTHFYWSAEDDDAHISFRVYESAIQYACEDANKAPLPGLFTPVMAVCGNTVACGGFWYDTPMADQHQAASVSSVNFRPDRVFTEEELDEAKMNAGDYDPKAEPDAIEVDGQNVQLTPRASNRTHWFDTHE
ncbi:hypothetical protein [Nitrogeniibacter aestuarii]|uniref:hypothetical protein n=1 Tax=Nitrogeniibacter aestuarii TaxID=2815343 RepID=UPI001E5AC443|nr:hypothetical protein [Nitrogeniibacter aestuarii]